MQRYYDQLTKAHTIQLYATVSGLEDAVWAAANGRLYKFYVSSEEVRKGGCKFC